VENEMMKSKKNWNILIIIAVIAVVAWRLFANKKDIDEVAQSSLLINPTVPVRVDNVKYLDLSSYIYVDGRINAGNECMAVSVRLKRAILIISKSIVESL
jgi:multidrug efflux pump subunit AcrA (membrane-fusion protein)